SIPEKFAEEREALKVQWLALPWDKVEDEEEEGTDSDDEGEDDSGDQEGNEGSMED
ncbi:hypothetical protein AAF712_014190, partial [Marasmius tenuissimus]